MEDRFPGFLLTLKITSRIKTTFFVIGIAAEIWRFVYLFFSNIIKTPPGDCKHKLHFPISFPAHL